LKTLHLAKIQNLSSHVTLGQHSRTDDPGFKYQQGWEIFLFSKMRRPAVDPSRFSPFKEFVSNRKNLLGFPQVLRMLHTENSRFSSHPSYGNNLVFPQPCTLHPILETVKGNNPLGVTSPRGIFFVFTIFPQYALFMEQGEKTDM
jgi:hypothetical protein